MGLKQLLLGGARSLTLACCSLLLGGCFIKVSAISDGNVISNLGEDCGTGCPYQVDAGENFRRTFTAEPWEGADFVGWKDDMGELLSACPSPIAPVCRIEISTLNPALAPLGMQVDAHFAVVSGFNIARFEYESTDYGKGVFRQVSENRWIEEHQDGQTQGYLVSSRGNTGMTLTDDRGQGLIIVDVHRKKISTSLLTHATEDALFISESYIRPSGALVNQVIYGDAFHIRRGYLQSLGGGRWEDREFAGTREPLPLQFVDADDESIRFRNQSGHLLVVDLETGEIVQKQPSGNEGFFAHVHALGTPVNGWNAAKISYGDSETGEIVGFFERQSASEWHQKRPGSRAQLAELTEVAREKQVIQLRDRSSGANYKLDLEKMSVGEGGSSGAFVKETWQIVAVN